MAGRFSGNSPAQARMPSVPNNFIVMSLSLSKVRNDNVQLSFRLLSFPSDFHFQADGGRMLQSDLGIGYIKVRGLFNMGLLALDPDRDGCNRRKGTDSALRALDVDRAGIEQHLSNFVGVSRRYDRW